MTRIITPLIILVIAFATPALAGSQSKPSQPEQPASGPGGEHARFPAAEGTHYGATPGGYWIWEPSTDDDASTPVTDEALPVVLYINGCCGSNGWTTPQEVDPWMTHLARQGYVIIAPVYHFGSPVEDSMARLTDALDELAQPEHARIDLDHFVAIGFSYGGMSSIRYAAMAEEAGLPVPQALFLSAPCTENGFCLNPEDTRPLLPDGLKAVVLAFASDDIVPNSASRRVYQELDSLPAADRDFVIMPSDDHGTPPIVANHQTTYESNIDAADWYGLWKLSDALIACTLNGEWCEYALGNTPEQRDMGEWSDGQAVRELVVED